jgi:fructose-specific phosphotransferase system IIC component
MIVVTTAETMKITEQVTAIATAVVNAIMVMPLASAVARRVF